MAKKSRRRESRAAAELRKILARMQAVLESLASEVFQEVRNLRRLGGIPEGGCVTVEAELDRYRYVLTVFPSGQDGELTSREFEIAVLAAQGLTNRTIAQRVGVQSATVATHLRSIYRKWRIASRIQLAQHLLRLTAGPSRN